jgi:hypothetical protein
MQNKKVKTRLLVKFDPRLGFFTPPKEGYRNRVRQVLDALWKFKHDILKGPNRLEGGE